MTSEQQNHRYSSDAYNKERQPLDSSPGTLVGNWFEESLQREQTERRINIHRSETNTKNINTFARVYGNPEALSSKQYLTTYLEELRSRDSERVQYDKLRRETLRSSEDLLIIRKEMAKELAREYQSEQCDFITTATASFTHPSKGRNNDQFLNRINESSNVHYSKDCAPNTVKSLEVGSETWPGRNTCFTHPVTIPVTQKKIESKPTTVQKLSKISYVNEHSGASLPQLRRVIQESLKRMFPGSDDVYEKLRKSFTEADVSIDDFILTVFPDETEYSDALRILLCSPWIEGPSKGKVFVACAVNELQCKI